MNNESKGETTEKSTRICGVRLDRLTDEELRSQLVIFLESSTLHHVVTPNPEFVVEAQGHRAFASVLEHASLALPDGIGLVFAEFFLHHRRLTRHPGADTIEQLAEVAKDRGLRIALLGGRGDVANIAASALRQRFAGLQVQAIEGVGDVPDPSQPDVGTIKRIQSMAPHILLVALGSPKQDLWIRDAGPMLAGTVRLAMGVGGSLDYLSGTVKRAPRWMRRCGLEWLYRGFRQPSRIRRLYRATVVFPLLVLKEKARG